MIFYFDQPERVEMWMRDTLIPLDIIFIDEDQEVIAVEQGQPEDDTLLSHENTMYVVEVNVNSGVSLSQEEVPCPILEHRIIPSSLSRLSKLSL